MRQAYRALARKWHPDRFQDPEKQEEANRRMIAINKAYDDAMRMVNYRTAPYNAEVEVVDALRLARKMLRQRGPESALRQLMRAESKNAEWYGLQGEILLAMHQYTSAHQSYREAVKREPDNRDYREGALQAALAMKKEKTLGGRVKKLFTGHV